MTAHADMPMTLAQAYDLLKPHVPAARLVGDGTTPLARVHTDTRTLQAGDLFVALKGERFDANAFLADARAGGAAAAIAHGGLEAAGLPGIEVPDSLAALGALAAGWRAQFAIPLVGVTGSNGKTTVTQMIASILRAWKGDAAFATQGNFNNDIGVPLTLLRLRAGHAAAVIEMGMNHPGEIATLATMGQPTVALVNNAQREHLEFMHTVEAVARENGSVFASLPDDGVAIFPAGDPYTALWQSLAQGRRCITFGDGGDVRCTEATWVHGAWDVTLATPQGSVATLLHIAGRHNVTNALAAAACAGAAGAPLGVIARGLEAFNPVKGRSRAFSVRSAGRDITVVDDTYNANPDSMRAAIDVLAELPGPQLMVLGDMGEVGDQGPQFHAEAGAHARAAGVPLLFALGAQSVHAATAYGDGDGDGGSQGRAHHFNDMSALLTAVRDALPTVGSVLVKGSRFMKMEQVVEAISATTSAAGQSAQPQAQEQQQTHNSASEGHHGATH
ncbi:MAG: UDP-N-acetylmuramoyl-tripeptide--D-alanyl-D-alanine ligase [Acidovorax sp.]|nr:MAG: UDP-N-acetylmuramoyl-tripeptide--D-alanyl-D-alanine ligase [Acidovorax sp.]